MDGIKIPFSESVKYLGITLDSKEENETYWHLATECPRLKSYREETFLDKPPVQDNWDTTSLINFCTYQTVYNMMSYNEDYNTQPIYELDYNYSCLLYTSPSPRDRQKHRMPSSA